MIRAVKNRAERLDMAYDSCKLEAFAKGPGGTVKKYPAGDNAL